MGNQHLVAALQRANYIPIDEKQVRFFEGRFSAEHIFQRHNFQMYRVRDSEPQKSAEQPQTYYLRIINSLNDDDSIAIIEHMQQTLIHISHANLVQYFAIAVEQEQPHIKFVILEEDLTDDSITLKSLLDTIRLPQNHLLAVYFSDKLFAYEFLLQALQALSHLNANGKTFGELHGDLSPMSIAIKFQPLGASPSRFSFVVKILDYLKIRDLVEIAQQQSFLSEDAQATLGPSAQTMIRGSSSPRHLPLSPDSKKNMLHKPLAYDAPERRFVNQKDIGIQADVWSLGLVLYEFLVAFAESKDAQNSINRLRLISYPERIKEIREHVQDVGMQELLALMLRDHDSRPTAEALLEHPILQFFSYITSPTTSLEDTRFLCNCSQSDSRQVVPALLSALSLGDKNKAIVSFFTLMRVTIAQKTVDPGFEQFLLGLVARQQAYVQIVELLVICMKEYSLSQSSQLAPQGRDSFAELYGEALWILGALLADSEERFEEAFEGFNVVTPTQMRKQIYLAGLFSLTLLLCEQVHKIASSVSTQPLLAQDCTYMSTALAFLSQFTEEASPTALVAAEKAGLVKDLIKMLDHPDLVGQQLAAQIRTFLTKISPLLPVMVLREIGLAIGSQELLKSQLHTAPAFQASKSIFKRFTVDLLTSALLKGDSDIPFEHAIASLIEFCAGHKTIQQASAFKICSESLRLGQELQKVGLQMKQDFGYTCHTCTALLQGLTDYCGPRVLYVCYSCAQLCHGKHDIEPIGYSSTKWRGCRCHLVQGFQVSQVVQTEDSRTQEQELGFHTCKARYETLIGGTLRTELCQAQLLLEPHALSQERSRLQALLYGQNGLGSGSKVRKSDQISILEAKQQSDLPSKPSASNVYTTESFDVVSVFSSDPFCQLAGATSPLQNASILSQISKPTSPNQAMTTENSQGVILSPSQPKSFMSRTLPTLQTPGEKQTHDSDGLRSTLRRPQGDRPNLKAHPLKNQSTESLALDDQTQGSGPDRIRAYFEVKVILGGFYDQIAIGLTSSTSFPLEDQFVGYTDGSIGFHADDGKCHINGDSFEYGSPYGSQSTVGCGFTQNGDVFFTRDGFQLPSIRGSSVWKEIDSQDGPWHIQLYPVVSMRGKLATVKVNFAQTEDFLFKTPIINVELDNPALNIGIDKSLLKMVATDLPRGLSQAIIDSTKSYLQRKIRESSESAADPDQAAPTNISMIEDFYQRLLAIRSGQKNNANTSSTSRSKTSIPQNSHSQANLRQTASTSNIQLYGSQNSSNFGLGSRTTGAVPNQKATANTSNQYSSKMKFHYPQAAAQQQYSLGSTKQKRTNISVQKKGTLSPTARLQQTSSLGHLSKFNNNQSRPVNETAQDSLVNKRPSVVSSQGGGGGSVQRTYQNQTVSKEHLISSRRSAGLKGPNQRGSSSQLNNPATMKKPSSLSKTRREQQQMSQLSLVGSTHHAQGKQIQVTGSLERNKPRATVAALKGSRSQINLIGAGAGQSWQSGRNTGAAGSGRVLATNSFQSKIAVQSRGSNRTQATDTTGHGVQGKRLSNPLASKGGVKHQQQLILVGSEQAKPIGQVGAGLSITKQGSRERDSERQSSLEIPSNYNSGANPSFFYGNQEISAIEDRSLQNPQTDSKSSLVQPAATHGTHQKSLHENSRVHSQVEQVDPLLQKKNYYSQSHAQAANLDQATQPDQAQQRLYSTNSPHWQAEEYVDQPISLALGTNAHQVKDNSGGQKSFLASMSSQQEVKSGPAAFYQAYTHSAQSLPNKKALSSGRVQSDQVLKPGQNVSTNLSHDGPNHSTKAHQVKTSYIKVPKPRLTSAMSAKQIPPAASMTNNSEGNQFSRQVPSSQAYGQSVQSSRFSSQHLGRSQAKPQQQLKPSQSQQVISKTQAVVQRSGQVTGGGSKLNFYPPMEAHGEVSVPASSSELDSSKQLGNQSRYKGHPSFIGSFEGAQDDDPDSQKEKNCVIF